MLDILEAIEHINTYRGVDRSDFDSDELIQIWFVHYLEIIGEAARRISGEMREQHTEVPWGQLIGMRNILVHGYFDVDLEIVWNAAQINVARLKEQVEAILRQMEEE